MTADILWLLITLFVGAFLGSLLAYDWGYRDGRRVGHKEERLWIEQASGMHDPVCTCATNKPEQSCIYHGKLAQVVDYYEGKDKGKH